MNLKQVSDSKKVKDQKKLTLQGLKKKVDNDGKFDLDDLGFLSVRRGEWYSDESVEKAEKVSESGYTFLSVDGPEYTENYQTWEELVEAEDIEGLLEEYND